MRRALVLAFTSLLALHGCGFRGAVAQDFTKASTSSQARDAALRSIPFNQMTPETRDKLWSVVNRPDIYRRLPVVSIECDPDLYLHMIRHPEVVVSIWHLMGITQVETERVAPYVVNAADGAGTRSRIELVYGTPKLHIFYGVGDYEGPLLKNRITGKCVMALKSDYYKGESGETLVQNRLDVFLTIDQRGIAMLAKTLHPLVGKAADHNFVETARFMGRLSKTAEENGRGVQQLAQQLDSVDAKTRKEFSDLAMLTHRRALYRFQNASAAVAREASSIRIPFATQPTMARPSRLTNTP